MFKLWKLWLLIIVLSVVISYGHYESESREVKMMQSMVGAYTFEGKDNTCAFLKDCIFLICIFGSVVMCIWGMISIYLGSHTNRELMHIRAYGEKLTGEVVACDVDTYYSVLGTKQYSYFVDFEVQGNKKRSSTLSSLYTEIGENVDIYYLPHSNKDRGGITLVNIDENPGNRRMLLGFLGLVIAICLFVCGKRVKEDKTVETEMRIKFDKHRVGLAFAITISVCAIGLIVLGVFQNMKDTHIKEIGERTMATIRHRQDLNNIIYRGDKSLYSYTLEFYLDGEKKLGNAKTVELLYRGDTVAVSYILDDSGNLSDVVLADYMNQVGVNHIYHGILVLMLSVVVWIDVYKRGQ